VAVIDYEGTYTLVFPCRRVLRGWLDTETGSICPSPPDALATVE
jgi:hypothetical protein